jgi:RecA/RadA recombinase
MAKVRKKAVQVVEEVVAEPVQTTEEMEANLTQPLVVKSRVPDEDLLSTGSTLLNLACSGRTAGGFFKGGIFYFVGDSGSGKTFLTMTCMAEAANNGYFNDYRFVLNCPENGALMDYEEFFGARLASRVEPPSGDWSNPQHANTLEEFYDGILDRVKQGPVIEILDSMDAISSVAEREKYEEDRKARQKGKDASGSYGTSKPKVNSAMMREVNNAIQKTGSILLLISQARMAIGFGAQFHPQTNSGGTALKFFSQLQMWTKSKGLIKRRANKKERPAGLYSQIKVEKNRVTGKTRTVVVPIYDSYGIDDVGGMIQFLIEEGHWKESKEGTVKTELFPNQAIPTDDLAASIEEQEMIPQLQEIVAQVWHAIEDELKLPRKKRYE